MEVSRFYAVGTLEQRGKLWLSVLRSSSNKVLRYDMPWQTGYYSRIYDAIRTKINIICLTARALQFNENKVGWIRKYQNRDHDAVPSANNTILPSRERRYMK